MKNIITQNMILYYTLNQIKIKFKTEGYLEIKHGPIYLVDGPNRYDFETSFILIETDTIIYLDPSTKDCCFWGLYPGAFFFGIMHFRLVKNFKTTINWHLKQIFEEVFTEKAQKIIEYTEETENQLFINKLV